MDWGYYLPPGGVQGKRVLSVGAGCGEDAKFFFDNGALLVYAVEPNPECVPYLLTNAANHIGLKPIFKMFKPEMLNLGFDLLKVDIEGYEVELLPYLGDVEQDIVIESHCNYTHDKLIALGFQPSKPLAADQAIGNGVAIFHRWRK
jgi:predicted nicotinamide N-methyase